MYRRQAATLIAMLLLVVACAATPFEERHTRDQLRAMLAAPQPRCETYGMAGWTPDPQCQRDDIEKRSRIREALVRLHAADVATAPACVRQYRISRDTVRKLGGDPDSTDSVAELITRGLLIASLNNGTCAAAVCDWRKRTEPAKENPYCDSANKSASAKL